MNLNDDFHSGKFRKIGGEFLSLLICPDLNFLNFPKRHAADHLSAGAAVANSPISTSPALQSIGPVQRPKHPPETTQHLRLTDYGAFTPGSSVATVALSPASFRNHSSVRWFRSCTRARAACSRKSRSVASPCSSPWPCGQLLALLTISLHKPASRKSLQTAHAVLAFA